MPAFSAHSLFRSLKLQILFKGLFLSFHVVQFSRFCSLPPRQELYLTTPYQLCQYFFEKFFRDPSRSSPFVPPRWTAYLYYHRLFLLSTPFFDFFKLFSQANFQGKSPLISYPFPSRISQRTENSARAACSLFSLSTRFSLTSLSAPRRDRVHSFCSHWLSVGSSIRFFGHLHFPWDKNTLATIATRQSNPAKIKSPIIQLSLLHASVCHLLLGGVFRLLPQTKFGIIPRISERLVLCGHSSGYTGCLSAEFYSPEAERSRL